MDRSKNQSTRAIEPSQRQLANIEQLLLWQEYCHQLQSIAGTLSDSYWVSQGLSMLKLNHQQPLQSKTKQALRILNGHNSKIQLINKILKNLSLCSTIDANQEKLVKQVMKITSEWENWKRLKIGQQHFQQGFLANGHHQMNENEDNKDQPENMESFEVDFDERRFREFESELNNQQKDVQI